MNSNAGSKNKGPHSSQERADHLKVYVNGKRSVLPMHGKRELSQPLVESIKKQLGLNKR